ncbi:acetyl-CoA carboxylase biotin carboxyl carrier protein subunit [Leptospira sp. 96542]|nr:acetyl-CoA carboxylase biotin carboxyl carrier protein subunit [Leptospira sp. 96542]
MLYLFETGDTITSVQLQGEVVLVRIGNKIHQFDFSGTKLQSKDSGVKTLVLPNAEVFTTMRIRNEVFCHYGSETWSYVLGERNLTAKTDESPEIKSPMPGKVVVVTCTEGTEYKQGESLMVLEAMKMENAIKAPYDCRVAKIHKNTGDLVKQGEVLVLLDRIDLEIT